MTKMQKKSFHKFVDSVTICLFFAKSILSLSYSRQGELERVQMYSKQQIIDTLNSEDLFIDNFLLEAFIKNWKLEPIYEDAQGVEFFDDMAVEKVRNGIKQKAPKCEINIIDKDDIKPVDMSVEISEKPDETEIDQETPEEIDVQPTPENQEKNEPEIEIEVPIKELPVAIFEEVNKEVQNELENEMKQVTLDISNQTLAVLAESIARKITCDVADFLKKTDFMEDAVQLGEYKKDNQILLQKIDEMISDNKILIKRIQELETENKSFVKLFGSIYAKNK